ncbi:50S ribosomal protein L13 [Nanoarchaeota archaeon]
MIINADDLIAGRLASFAAKKALLGNKVDIVNCEKAVITGNKKRILERYKQKREMGIPLKGPYISRTPEQLLRRIVRGMLPYKQEKGKLAFQKVKCHRGIPQEFEGKDMITIQKSHVEKLPNLKYISINDISKFLRSK